MKRWRYRHVQYNNDDFFNEWRIERRLCWLPFFWFDTGIRMRGEIGARVFVAGMNA